MTSLKNKIRTFYLKNAERVFPNELQVMRHHDFLNLRVKKARYLNKTERNVMEKIADFSDAQIGNGSDLIVKRVKKKLEVSSF